MRNDLDALPNRAHQLLAILVSLVCLAMTGAALFFFVRYSPNTDGVFLFAISLFSVLFSLSAFVFYRSAFTKCRRLSTNERRNVSRGLVAFGGGGLLLACLFGGPIAQRLLLLSSGLACLSYGLRRPRP
jgi:hypothetical protein